MVKTPAIALAQRFQELLQIHLSSGQRTVDRIVNGEASKAEIQALYVQIQSLSLSAEAYALKSFEKVALRICQHLLKFQHRTLSEAQASSFTKLYQKLTSFLELDLSKEFELQKVTPRVCFYGIDSQNIARILKKIGHQELHTQILDSLDAFFHLNTRDIVLFKLNPTEQNRQTYNLLLSCKFLPMNQVVYLADEEDDGLRLNLGAIGIENFFLCKEGEFYLSRFFADTFTNLKREVRPYKLCVIGNKPTLLALEKLLQLYGVETCVFGNGMEALAYVRQNSVDGFVVDNLETEFDSSALVNAIRQLHQYKLTPVFHLDRIGGEISNLNIDHHVEASIYLSKEVRLEVLLLDILSHLHDERKLNMMARHADEATQETSDWRAGLDFHNIVSIADKSGKIIEVNDTFCQISGYSREELLGQDHRIVNSGYHDREFFQTMWKTIATGNPWKGEVCNRAKNGNLYWVESSIVPILDINGRPQRYVSIRTDISHLKKIETNLIEAQALASLGHWEADMRTGELVWSDEIFAIFGFDRKTYKPSVLGFKSAIHPDDIPLVEASEKLAQTNGKHDVVHRIIRPDGSIRHVHELARAFYDQNGDVCRLTGTVQDVTEIMQTREALEISENRLTVSQRFANIGTWDYNIQTGDLFWSERISPLFGGPQQAMETTYENFVAALHPEDRQMVLDAVTDCIENGAEYNLEHRVVWADGTVRWLHESGDVIRAADGTAKNMLGVVQDVTRRKEAEDALIKATLRAEQADKAKSKFLSSMSHELRTPLNAIIGFAQLLEVMATDDNLKMYSSHILQAGNHLLELINDILDLSKVESGEVALNMEEFLLADVIRDALLLTEINAEEKGIKIHAPNMESLVGLNVYSDFTRLKQVLINLISNAVKYNRPQGQVYIEVDRSDGFLGLKVRDTGMGISKVQQQQLFTPFNRLSFENSSIEGTGIGLSICKHLVEQMNGELRVESEEGVGSVFTICLPFQMDFQAAPAIQTLTETPIKITQSKLLLIDNDTQTLQEMNQIIEKGDALIEFLAAPTGSVGIAVAKRQQPQIILISLDLMDISGYKVLDQLKNLAELKESKILAIKSNPMATDSEIAKQSGFVGLIEKPLRAEAIFALLE